MKLNLYTSFDQKYAAYGLVLVRSFRKFDNGRIFVHGVDLKPEVVKQLNETPNLKLLHESRTDWPKIPRGARVNRRMNERRQEMLRKTVDEEGPLIVLDADSFVTMNLDHVAAYIANYDLVPYIRDRKHPKRRVYSGIMGYNMSKKLAPYFSYYEKNCTIAGNIGNIIVSDQFWMTWSLYLFWNNYRIGNLKECLKISRRYGKGREIVSPRPSLRRHLVNKAREFDLL